MIIELIFIAGMQGDPLVATNPIGLPLTEKLLPQVGKKFHIVKNFLNFMKFLYAFISFTFQG